MQGRTLFYYVKKTYSEFLHFFKRFCTFRGMLTGKFKRNVVPDEKGSRAGYLDAMKKQGKIYFSHWEDVAHQDSFWTLMDLIKNIAKKHGMVEHSTVINLFHKVP